jgi:uncharacterized protein (TIGR04255 family)
MQHEEVYVHPTVNQVIFQIRFPNLFTIASKIGDLQVKIMDRFPESNLLQSRSILIADLPPDAKLNDLPEPPPTPGSQTIWQFISPEGVQLNVTNSSHTLSLPYNTRPIAEAMPRPDSAMPFSSPYITSST